MGIKHRRVTRTLRLGLLAISLGASIAGCEGAVMPGSDTPPEAHAIAGASAATVQTGELLVPWGSDTGSFSRTQRDAERPGEGPSALAIAADGSLFVLDRLAGRIAAIAEDGSARTFAAIASDAEDLATGGDALVAYSFLRARAWIIDAQGRPAGELALPRELRDLVSVELGASRRVLARTAYQELLDVGGPSAPAALEVILASKLEGAARLPDGRGVAAHASTSAVELWVMGGASDGRHAEPSARFTVPRAATAARVVGVDGSIACLRVEQVDDGAVLHVERRAVCIDTHDGAVALDEALPPAGSYLPRRELAVGAGLLAFMHPTDDGLSIRRYSLRPRPSSTAGAEAEVTP